jgi:hypothetical protein
MGNIVAFNPCSVCKKEMCSMCELEMRRSGSISSNKWISVDERLPEENGRYLACVNISHFAFENLTTIAIMAYGKNHGFYLYNETEKVTHWMPLPEPPKMKGGAE